MPEKKFRHADHPTWRNFDSSWWTHLRRIRTAAEMDFRVALVDRGSIAQDSEKVQITGKKRVIRRKKMKT
jgi:hypothetical protein